MKHILGLMAKRVQGQSGAQDSAGEQLASPPCPKRILRTGKRSQDVISKASLSLRAEYECFQIELSKNYSVTEWRDDVRKIMMKAGLESIPKTFLFVDTQVWQR